jgi:nifR3 family TIM-barrel protein
MKFGNNELEYGLFLGPMAGVTDTVYRQLCQEQGCEVTYTEMVSAKAIYYGNKKTDTLLTIEDKEFNVGIQLFGSDPELIGEMAKQIDNERISSFDVNMGCPVPKVVNNGEGSALMKNPKLIGEIVESLVKAVDKPISIKIRSGFNEESINAVEVSKIAESAGASLIAIHGRTREQYYSGKANWDIIAQVKEAVNIPIIGNGDIKNGKDLLAMKEQTHCDGFMVGRAAMGNPWIFKELISAIKNEVYVKPTVEEIMKMILRHGEMLIEHKGELVAMREMRKHVTWYIRGFDNAAKLRHETNTVEKFEDLVKLVDKMLL